MRLRNSVHFSLRQPFDGRDGLSGGDGRDSDLVQPTVAFVCSATEYL
jgi:hypothetical protein